MQILNEVSFLLLWSIILHTKGMSPPNIGHRIESIPIQVKKKFTKLVYPSLSLPNCLPSLAKPKSNKAFKKYHESLTSSIAQKMSCMKKMQNFLLVNNLDRASNIS
ncbi:hypothetical protein ACKWTF_010423 [Chironomus riparius]